MLSEGQRKEHALNRTGYGVGLWHSNRYDELGFDAYIAEQIGQTLPALGLGDDDVFINTKVRRSVLAERQLETVLLDFWFNHFNVDAFSNVPNARLNNPIGRNLVAYQNDALAPNVLGSFADMLVATAKSTPMLRYLDNYRNRKPAVLDDGTTVGYNENYAREVMELHTLGIDGGYTETDVQEVTRILTGWTYRALSFDPPEVFVYFHSRHDTGAKTVMGVTYPAGRGIVEGEALLDFLATHESTAKFLSQKLCVRFVGDEPPATAVDDAATTFSATSGDLNAVMNTILTSAEFGQPAQSNFRSKVKPMHRYLASALMAMGATEVDDWLPIEGALVDNVVSGGDTPYFFPPPTGYPEAAGFWMSGASMLARFDMAERIAYRGSLVERLKARTGQDGSDITAAYDAIVAAMIPGGVSAETEAAVKDHVAANAMNNFQRVAAIAHMLLVSPEFVRY